jgi:hypothetical protein
MNRCRIQRLRKHSPAGISSYNKRVFNKTTQSFSFSPEALVEFEIEAVTDTDSDGYTDEAENQAGTNPNDPAEFPVSLFNVFNNV